MNVAKLSPSYWLFNASFAIMFLLLINVNTVDAGLLRNLAKPTSCGNVRRMLQDGKCGDPCLENNCGQGESCMRCETYKPNQCTATCTAGKDVCASYKCVPLTTTTTTTAPASGTDGETGGGCIEDELPCTGGCGDCCSRTSTNLGGGEKMCGVATETETASTSCQIDTDCSKDGTMWCYDPCGSGGGMCGAPSTAPCIAIYLPVW